MGKREEKKHLFKLSSELIKFLKKEEGWTLKKISKVTGLSESYIRYIERRKKYFTIKQLKKLAKEFNIHWSLLAMGAHTQLGLSSPDKCSIVSYLEVIEDLKRFKQIITE